MHRWFYILCQLVFIGNTKLTILFTTFYTTDRDAFLRHLHVFLLIAFIIFIVAIVFIVTVLGWEGRTFVNKLVIPHAIFTLLHLYLLLGIVHDAFTLSILADSGAQTLHKAVQSLILLGAILGCLTVYWTIKYWKNDGILTARQIENKMKNQFR